MVINTIYLGHPPAIFGGNYLSKTELVAQYIFVQFEQLSPTLSGSVLKLVTALSFPYPRCPVNSLEY